MSAPIKRALPWLCVPLVAVGMGACGNALSSTTFKGESHLIAQAISNLQTDVTAGDGQKVCRDDLASAVLTHLNASKDGCKQVIKNQLSEIDSFELSVRSIQVSGAATAKATVNSIYAGKHRLRALSLVKENGKWKISSLG